MSTTALRIAARRATKAVSFALLFKSAVGFSVAVLALFGVAVPLFGFNPTPVAEGGAALTGALLGAILALRA
jgi:putative exporter of polyketide antibiotics